MEDLVGYSSSTSSREESASPLIPSTLDMTQDSRPVSTQNSRLDTMETSPPPDTTRLSQPDAMETSPMDTLESLLLENLPMESLPLDMMGVFQVDMKLPPSSGAPVFPESPERKHDANSLESSRNAAQPLPLQISLRDAVEVESRSNDMGTGVPPSNSNMSTRPDFVQGSSSSTRAAGPPQVVTSSFARPPPEFVQGSSSGESATFSVLDPPEHHRVGNLMTFGQWRDMVRHLLANSRRDLHGVLNLYYLDNPFSRPRDGIDEEAQGTAIDMALDRLTLRLVMVPPPFRPAGHVNPDSVGMLTWLYVSAAIGEWTAFDSSPLSS
ncbi:hypothetical protein PQX77_019280 [Marasmius sp. AFHP31]|nr:hypothetical protein PQX77_019280 [Marasmius sp. AFHP31]